MRPNRILLAVLLTLLSAAALLAASKPFHGNSESRVFHESSCKYYNCKNCTVELKSYNEAIDRGFRPCKICKPSGTSPTAKNEAKASYVGNTSSHKLHRSNCRYADCANCTARFASRDKAIEAGYVPGKCCNP